MFTTNPLIPGGAAQATHETAVAKAYVANDGRVHLVDATGHETVAPAETEQAGCSLPKISPDHRTLGWAVDYMTGGQTYAIPLVLVIYRSGKVIDRFSDRLMIWEWQFQNHGKRVAIATGPTHGTSTPSHYELRDTKTGRSYQNTGKEEAHFRSGHMDFDQKTRNRA